MPDFREAGTGKALQGVEVFKAGTWNASTGPITITSSDLDQIVANFHNLNKKVAGFGVPIKLGHNSKVGEPSFGWMSDLARVDDTLVADFADVDPAIVDAIGKRSYNSVSIELRNAVKYGEQVFSKVLSGVALLGAEWPAVKGLKPLSASLFSEDGETIELKERLNVPNFTEEQHNAILAAEVEKATATFKAQVDSLTTKLAASAAQLATFAEEAEKKELADIIKAAEDKGQIVPAMKAKIEAFAEQVRKATGEGRAALLSTFKEFVASLPSKVKFGEQGSDHSVKDGDSAHETVVARVQELRAKDAKLSYEAAVDMVFAADADLKTAYAKEIA